VSPNLPVAAWKSAPVNLEDFKGQVVVLVFYKRLEGLKRSLLGSGSPGYQEGQRNGSLGAD